jgi:hypothetical protein
VFSPWIGISHDALIDADADDDALLEGEDDGLTDGETLGDELIDAETLLEGD